MHLCYAKACAILRYASLSSIMLCYAMPRYTIYYAMLRPPAHMLKQGSCEQMCLRSSSCKAKDKDLARSNRQGPVSQVTRWGWIELDMASQSNTLSKLQEKKTMNESQELWNYLVHLLQWFHFVAQQYSVQYVGWRVFQPTRLLGLSPFRNLSCYWISWDTITILK